MIWTKSAIRAARKAELAPLLIDRGYRLLPLSNGNFRILPAPDDQSTPASPEPCRGVGVIVKHNFWLWSEKNIAGNAIDFFTRVEGRSFHQAMQIISEVGVYDPSEREIPEELGNATKTIR